MRSALISEFRSDIFISKTPVPYVLVNEVPKDHILEFRRLCAQAEAVYSRADSSGDPDLLPFCHDILRLISQHPMHQIDFEQAFRDLWNNNFVGPWEIIPFCMHYLRWANFRDFIESVHHNAIQQKDWRCIPVTLQVIDCFHDDWNGLEMFYGNTHQP